MSTSEFNFQISTRKQKILTLIIKSPCQGRVWGLWFAGIVWKPEADIVIEIYGDNTFGDKTLGISIWTTLLISSPLAYDRRKKWCCCDKCVSTPLADIISVFFSEKIPVSAISYVDCKYLRIKWRTISQKILSYLVENCFYLRPFSRWCLVSDKLALGRTL